MSDSNKKILLVLLGIALIVASVVFVVRPKKQSIDSLNNEISTLQARYDDLCAKELQKDQLIAETAEFNKHFDEEVVKYASDLDQENAVMFFKEIEEEVDFANLSIAMPRETNYYVLGEGAVEANEMIEAEDDSYIVTTDTYAIGFSGTYEGVKAYLDYILNYKYRMAVETISISYSEDADAPIAECSGSLTLNTYAVESNDRKHDVPTVDVEEGKENIFAVEGTALPASAGSSSHDSGNGDDIVANHNIVILLNDAANDAASGIIVAADESKEDTYVTSSENKVETVEISVTAEDGKNYVTYKIGSKSYKAEVLSSDVTVYVKSSSRTGDDDKNGVDVKVSNDTDLSVYFKVVGYDSYNPRFKISQKSGTVKEY
jgi:hypothetical protein